MKSIQIDHSAIKVSSIQDRYLTNVPVLQFLKEVPGNFLVETLGHSVLDRPIMSITMGSGNKKILMWSQMHGNESTTTKAVVDLINLFALEPSRIKAITEACTIKIIPILNPDGAAAYTRYNANKIDLNRDAKNQSQPESQLLRRAFDVFKPDFCFNLHDQRTIFNVGHTPKPATVSFLAPAYNEERSISLTRETSMKVIVAMNRELQKHIPGQVGRYDDSFNDNCVGDTFQMLKVPTILFEAGHFGVDYQREKTRALIFRSLWTAIGVIANNTIEDHELNAYFEIPENGKLFYDIIIKNADLLNNRYKKGSSLGIVFKEKLEQERIIFDPAIEKVGTLEGYFGHKVYNCLKDRDLRVIKGELGIN